MFHLDFSTFKDSIDFFQLKREEKKKQMNGDFQTIHEYFSDKASNKKHQWYECTNEIVEYSGSRIRMIHSRNYNLKKISARNFLAVCSS